MNLSSRSLKISAGNAGIKSHNAGLKSIFSITVGSGIQHGIHTTEKYWSSGPRLCTPAKKILRAPLLEILATISAVA